MKGDIMQFNEGTLKFLDLLCFAIHEKPIHAALAYFQNGGLYSHERWCGGYTPKGQTTADWVASAKLHELYWQQRTQGPCAGDEFRFSPVEGFAYSRGWLGAVQHGNHLASVSGWDPEHDVVMALLAIYHMCYRRDLELNSVCHTTGGRDAAIEKAGPSAYHIKETGCDRWFQLMQDPRTMMGHYFIEHRYIPGQTAKLVRILDIWTSQPLTLTNFLDRALSHTRVPYEHFSPATGDTENGIPASIIWVSGESGSLLGISARKSWWPAF